MGIAFAALAWIAIGCGSSRDVAAGAAPAPPPMTPLFASLPMGARWPGPVEPGIRPKLVEVPERLEGRDIQASVLLACGRSVAGVAGEVDVQGSADAVALGARIEARFAREGFTRGAKVGGPIAEALEIAERISAHMKEHGAVPGPEAIPRAWAERKLERALFADTDAIYLATFARGDMGRTLQVMCLKQRCEVSVTEERASCDEPGGIVMADISGDATAP